jgi:hypothetical protein
MSNQQQNEQTESAPAQAAPAQAAPAQAAPAQAAQENQRLYAALAAARAEVKPIEKDGETTSGAKYTYASAQAIFAAAGPLLGRHGLALIPIDMMFLEEKSVLNRDWLLTHSSGDYIDLRTETPVVIVKFSSGSQTPRDKALIAALTVSHRTLLRDLLAIPAFEDSEEIEKRDDSGGQETWNRPGHGREARREQPAQQQQTAANGENPDITARKEEIKAFVLRARAELGQELCAQIGADKDPRSMQELEALGKKLGEAVRNKRAKEREQQPKAESETKPDPDSNGGDWAF